jgi:4-carboxymuconolactone decarboxylase
MARLSPATRDTVPESQRDVFDEIVGSGSPAATGPGSVTIHVPEAGKRLSALNQYLRETSSLPKKVQELAMLVTAREMDCQYVWNAHAASAKAEGVPAAVVDALREGDDMPPLAPDEAAVINYGQEFYRTHRISSGTFQAVQESLGKQGLVELTMIMGNYALMAFLVNSFDSSLPATRTELLLPVV